MIKENISKWTIVSFFAIAMAFLESAVVIYLRALFYPEGFDFPLQLMDLPTAKVEFFREVATLVMLITVAMLCSKTRIARFAYFIYLFAVWDIFYYVFLKVFLNWPTSLLTWDILFLIPTTWVGPVIAPIINSLCMIVLAQVILFAEKRGIRKIVSRIDWALLIVGSLVVIIAYLEDFMSFLFTEMNFAQMLKSYYSQEIIDLSTRYVPKNFAWAVFSSGVGLHLLAIFNIHRRSLKTTIKPQVR